MPCHGPAAVGAQRQLRGSCFSADGHETGLWVSRSTLVGRLLYYRLRNYILCYFGNRISV